MLMIPLLLLAPAVLAVLAILSAGVDPEPRGRFLQGLCVAGAMLGLALFFASPLHGEVWRTAYMSPSGTRLAGIAVAAAWMVAAVGERSRGGGRWDLVALTGAAGAGTGLFAVNRWTVPALLFVAIASLALALLDERRAFECGAVCAGIGLLAASLVWRTLETESWTLPVPVSGARLWVVVAAGVAFALVPIVADRTDRPSPSIPLALGISFAVFGSAARAAGPVVALVLVGIALAAVVRALVAKEAPQRLVIVWVVAVTVGLAALSDSPYVTARAGIAGILAASALSLWPLSLGRAQIERGILVAFVAVTAGFNAIAAAAADSFDKATTLEAVLDAAPWAAMSALLPAALAGGVALGASVGRNPEPEGYTRSGVLGSWAFVVLTVVVGVSPYVGASSGGSVAGPALYVVAVVAGVVAARYVKSLGMGEAAVSVTSRFRSVPIGLSWPRLATLAAAGVGGVTALAVIALTYRGLRLGFL